MGDNRQKIGRGTRKIRTALSETQESMATPGQLSGSTIKRIEKGTASSDYTEFYLHKLRAEADARDRAQLVTAADELLRMLHGPDNEFDFSLLAPYGRALQADRDEQWAKLVELCASGDDALVVLEGDEKQSLERVVDRTFLDLESGAQRSHRMILIRKARHRDELYPLSANTWIRRIADALPRTGYAPIRAIAAESEHNALLIMAGPIPFDDLDERERRGLEALIECLPKRVPQMRSLHPLRFLLVCEDTSEESREAVEAMATFAARTLKPATPGVKPPVRFFRLPRVEFPPWTELETFLRRVALPEPLMGEVKARYEAVCMLDLRFSALIDFIDDLLRKTRSEP